LAAGQPEPRLFRFPEDDGLPGLARAADPDSALDLIGRYVGVHPATVAIEVLRYRPASRAVLAYRLHWRRGQVTSLDMVGRALRPGRTAAWLAARDLMANSGFVIPKALGHWPEGEAVWMDWVPGKTLRRLIQEEAAPDPEVVLAGLAPLWPADADVATLPAYSVQGAANYTLPLIRRVLSDGEIDAALGGGFEEITGFVHDWRPVSAAHNDFYDDQVIVMPSGQLAVVDFEEAGGGDPLLDVGNLLAHLRWMGTAGPAGQPSLDYHKRVWETALHSFGWSASDLALREAFALFHLSANPLRGFQNDGRRRVLEWLDLAGQALRGHTA
jgi:hypothetical protein